MEPALQFINRKNVQFESERDRTIQMKDIGQTSTERLHCHTGCSFSHKDTLAARN